MISSQFIKFVMLVLVLSVLFLSCKANYKQIVSVEKAIASEQKIKIVLLNDEKYTFCKLVLKENELFGITKINSSTAKKMDSLIVRCSVDGKVAIIELNQKNIKEIYLKKGN